VIGNIELRDIFKAAEIEQVFEPLERIGLGAHGIVQLFADIKRLGRDVARRDIDLAANTAARDQAADSDIGDVCNTAEPPLVGQLIGRRTGDLVRVPRGIRNGIYLRWVNVKTSGMQACISMGSRSPIERPHKSRLSCVDCLSSA